MFRSTSDIGSKSHRGNEMQEHSDEDVEELKSRVAVRFLVKKSRRFDLMKQQLQYRLQQTKIAMKSEPSPECLVYLGLSPNTPKTHERKEQQMQNERPDFQFLKPRVYECNYCNKFFFHKVLYRRHMMHHMKKIYWCSRCSRRFTTKITKKRHELSCRR